MPIVSTRQIAAAPHGFLFHNPPETAVRPTYRQLLNSDKVSYYAAYRQERLTRTSCNAQSRSDDLGDSSPNHFQHETSTDKTSMLEDLTFLQLLSEFSTTGNPNDALLLCHRMDKEIRHSARYGEIYSEQRRKLDVETAMHAVELAISDFYKTEKYDKKTEEQVDNLISLKESLEKYSKFIATRISEQR